MAAVKTRSLPVTADPSAPIDQELAQLMRDYPGHTQLFLHKLVSGADQVEKAKVQRRTNLFERELEELPESNYKSTYRPKDCKPRSSKRPLRSPPVFTENGDPCNFETAYKSEFKPLDLSDKVTLSKKDNRGSQLHFSDGEAGEGPRVSAYKENYVSLDLGKAHQEAVHRPRTQTKLPVRRFDGTTTNKSHYTLPVRPAAQMTFGELPSFAGSVIFPTGKFDGVSTSKLAYQPYLDAERVESNKSSPFKATLKPEGLMDMTTVHRSTYKPLPLDERLPKAVPPKGEINLKEVNANAFRTQSMDDYQYRPTQPPHPAHPLRSYINLREENRSSYETEQRSQYRGFDTSVHPPPKPVKHEVNMSRVKSDEKFDGSTCNKMTYVAHDLASAYSAPVLPKPAATGLLASDIKFSSDTTSKDDYRDWSPQMPKERYRHGDFTEALKAFAKAAEAEPPAKFASETTFRSAYVPLPLERVHKMEPLKGNIKVEGDRELQTVYRGAFPAPRPRLTNDDLRRLRDYLQEVRSGPFKVASTPQSRQS